MRARRCLPAGVFASKCENAASDMVEIKVSDTGQGILPDQLRMIFEPFFTTKKPDEYGRGGTGLASSVCRQIIEHHQGESTSSAWWGKGSTFTVRNSRKRIAEDPE